MARRENGPSVGRFGFVTKRITIAISSPLGRIEKEHFERALETEKDAANKAYRRRFMMTQLYPADHAVLVKAKSHFEEALALQPHHKKARKWLVRVDQALSQP